MLADLPIILQWYVIISGMGIIFLPLTKKIFGHFFDRGYLLSKILGLLLVSYTVWLLSSLHIAPFTQTTIAIVLIAWIGVNLALKLKAQMTNVKSSLNHKTQSNLFGFWNLKFVWHLDFGIWIFEEALFLLAFLFWVWVRGHEPSIHGLEKFMDYGFMNSIFNTKYFPPADMWLTQASDPRYTGRFFINYYYFGHYVTAFLTKLTAIPSEITYNLMLAQIFAFCFGGSFTIGANLMYLFMKSKILSTKSQINSKQQKSNSKQNVLNFELENSNLFGTLDFRFWIYRVIIAGLLTASLVTLAGNLHTIYLFTSGYQNDHPVPFWQIMRLFESAPDGSIAVLPGFTKYWYPNATRFIPNTIHEFPSYSWVVADLHGHVLDIPFVLLTIALLLAFITKSQIPNLKSQINTKSQAPNSKQNVLNLKFRSLNLSRLCGIPLWRRFGTLDFGFWILPLLGLTTAIMYMTNAWDGIIYLGLTGLVIVASQLLKHHQSDQQLSNQAGSLGIGNSLGQLGIRSIRNSINYCIVKVGIVVVVFFLFSLPFTHSFQPFVHGIGIVGGWEMANAFNLIKPLTNSTSGIETVANNLPKVVRFGPLLLEQGNNLRSPLWMLPVLWGFFYVNVIIFLILIIRKIKSKIQSIKSQINSKQQASNYKQDVLNLGFKPLRFIWNLRFWILNLSATELFLLLLVILSTALLIFPEFFYMKDIYPGHYRANTMFKLGYQAFIMLSIVSGYVITQISIPPWRDKLQITNQISSFKSQTKPIGSLVFGNSLGQLGIRIIRLILFFLLILVLIYPYFSIQSYYAPFKTNVYFRQYDSMDGSKWIKDAHLGDYETIQWFKKQLASGQIMPQDVVLEAVGDSYTDYGRISSYTGLSTVLGWPVHEWLWRGSYDEPGKRVEEVRQMYEATDTTQLIDLLNKFSIKYVVLGALEREKYKNVNETLIDDLARPVFSSGNTTVYQRN